MFSSLADLGGQLLSHSCSLGVCPDIGSINEGSTFELPKGMMENFGISSTWIVVDIGMSKVIDPTRI
jgi:hypothetical protein